ncbi:carbamoyl transferase [Patescibacteria group bacterium]|nr:MAG: carbamoyl transferase [Patescibacteria group bacterium]
MKEPVYILGLNFAYHELSACLIKNGKLLAAVEEERFSRIKRGKRALVSNPDTLPERAIRYCLNYAGITLKDVDYIGLPFLPDDRLKNINTDPYFIKGDWGSDSGEKLFVRKIKTVPTLLSKLAKTDLATKISWIPHHECHASSAFFVSPFRESAILSIDGIGEFSTTWLGYGEDNEIKVVKEILYPNSIGFLWEKISKYLGFTEYDSSKVMGLAAYGNPSRFYKVFQHIVKLYPTGDFALDNNILRLRINDFSQLEEKFGVRRIFSPSEVRKDQEDIAAALQKITNDVIIHLAQFLKKNTNSKNICLAGGVALNCVSNGLLMNKGIYRNLYIQPASNDAGTSLGAAYYIWNQILHKKRTFCLNHVYWGPGYSDKEIKDALIRWKIKSYRKVDNIALESAKKITEDNIVGWFQGRAEWGPRALGNRSLLVDPRRADMKQVLNERIKKRESFRPFAPSVLANEVSRWFVSHKKCKSVSTEFMEINFTVKKSRREKIPAVTHVDGTSRIQVVNKKTNPLYYKLITYFYKLTGVPILLNTSFNENEPIVCSPDDAIKTFLRTKIDYLAIGNYLVSKKHFR